MLLILVRLKMSSCSSYILSMAAPNCIPYCLFISSDFPLLLEVGVLIIGVESICCSVLMDVRGYVGCSIINGDGSKDNVSGWAFNGS